MRIEQLQAFLAIIETGSFQQAARTCSCTQSTISRQIQSLEEDLGIPLFHRHHQAKLTIGGEKLMPHARSIGELVSIPDKSSEHGAGVFRHRWLISPDDGDEIEICPDLLPGIGSDD